jgi:hypothetical protein
MLVELSGSAVSGVFAGSNQVTGWTRRIDFEVSLRLRMRVASKYTPGA